MIVPVWLWKAADEPMHGSLEPEPESCEGCGQHAEQTARYTNVLSSGFSEHPALDGPPSGRFCPACTHALNTDTYRRRCWIATPTDTVIIESEGQMQRVRTHLENPPEEPWGMYVTTTFVKHGSYKVRPNTPGQEPLRVLFNATQLELPREYINELLPLLDRAYRSFSKNALLTGDYNRHRVQDYGVRAWKRLEQRLAEHRGSSEYAFLVKLCRDESE